MQAGHGKTSGHSVIATGATLLTINKRKHGRGIMPRVVRVFRHELSERPFELSPEPYIAVHIYLPGQRFPYAAYSRLAGRRTHQTQFKAQNTNKQLVIFIEQNQSAGELTSSVSKAGKSGGRSCIASTFTRASADPCCRALFL